MNCCVGFRWIPWRAPSCRRVAGGPPRLSPPLDAVVLDFVAFFYEHFDNNEGANYRAAVTFDPQHAK